MIRIDREKAVAVIEISGRPTLADMMEAIEALLDHPDHENGMDELWDFRNASMNSLQTNDLIALAYFVGQHMDRLGKRTALVIGSDLDYGIGRMWESYADTDAPQERNLFRNIEAAFEWLAS